MLIIINCRAVYDAGGDILHHLVQRPEITVAICGNIGDVDSGMLSLAKSIFQTRNYEICAGDNTLSNIAMIRILANRFNEEPQSIIMVSEDQRDRLAANAFGCRFASPAEMSQLLLKGA